MGGVPLVGPGWRHGEWSEQYQSYTWQWCHDNAPHAPGPDWSLVQDGANVKKRLKLNEDWAYSPRDHQDDAVPGPSESGGASSSASTAQWLDDHGADRPDALGADRVPGDGMWPEGTRFSKVFGVLLAHPPLEGVGWGEREEPEDEVSMVEVD